jgi:hypothetical protein
LDGSHYTLRLFTHQNLSNPQNGDAYINYHGELEIYHNYRWNKMVSQQNFYSMLSASPVKPPPMSHEIWSRNFSKNLDQIVEALILLMIRNGTLENVQEFKDLLDSKKVAEELTQYEK